MISLFAFLQTSVSQTDALTRLLHQPQLTPWMIAAAVGIAFVLGAAHALTPGHGKTIVAAYLVGSRGTLKHAAFLGAMVTFTHTVSVFLLGLATLFLFQYVVPQKVTQVLGAISGLSIVAIGGWMLYKRLGGARHTHSHDHVHPEHHEHAHVHDHSHVHDHAHAHSHDHSHEHHREDHAHTHSHDHAHEHTHSHGHSHGPGGHTHMPDEISWSGLVALGASGGLVPCESALVLLLTAIALRRVGLGLLLLVSFSLGLALVLMAIGILVIYAKNLLPSSSGGNPFFRWMPVASAAVVMMLGVVMTGVSLGWIQPHWISG
jgi:nickel/cobalt exporter